VETPGAVFRVDFLWPAPSLAAEADGLLKYNDRRDMVRQLGRDQLLRDAGFRVVHFTWAELFGAPGDVVGRIRRAAAATTPY
jgi:very-short-patch-repair endonuclease